MKTTVFLKRWCRDGSIAVVTGVLLGFFSGVFALSVPFTHSMSFGHYRLAIFCGLVLFVGGLMVADHRIRTTAFLFPEELADGIFRKEVASRVYRDYIGTYFLTWGFVFFADLVLRTQTQWTGSAVLAAKSIVFFLVLILGYLSVRKAHEALFERYGTPS